MNYRKFILTSILAISVAGCAAVAKVEKGRVNIDGVYTVQNDAEWASIKLGNMHLWTLDGPALQQLRFITGVEDGETMFASNNPEKLAKFRGTMNELEVVEFFQASAAALGIQSMNTSKMRPVQFGTKPGFRFDFDYLTKNGLAMAGFATGAVFEKKLYMIFYVGTRQHYFDKRREEAQRVMESVRFL
jgi:hypothetical protein